MDQFALPYSTMQLWWPAGGGWGKEGSLDGGRGAKSRADRERGQGREVVRGGQGAGRVGHQLGRSHPDDHPWLSPQGHSVCRRGCWGNGAAGCARCPQPPANGGSFPFSAVGIGPLAGRGTYLLDWDGGDQEAGRGGQGKPKSQKNSGKEKRGDRWRLEAGLWEYVGQGRGRC